MKLFPSDPTDFALGTWAAALRPKLLPRRLVPDWHPETQMRRASTHRWIQYEPDRTPGPFFWLGKPAVTSSDNALFVGYYVERGLDPKRPLSHSKPGAEKIDDTWHWKGFAKCLEHSALRSKLNDLILTLSEKSRVIWIYSGSFPAMRGSVDEWLRAYTSENQLKEAKEHIERIDRNSPDNWINAVIGAEFTRIDCVERQDGMIANFDKPIRVADDIRRLIAGVMPDVEFM
jgi:hypothetical protein